MAEANSQNEPSLEGDNQENQTNQKEHTDKSQGNAHHETPKTEKPIVYRNYGAVTVKPLLLRNHHWSTKDIRDKLSSTAQGSDVRQYTSTLTLGKYTNVADNLFKRQDSITTEVKVPPVGSSPDVCDVKSADIETNLMPSHLETSYPTCGDVGIIHDNSEQSKGINDVTTEKNVTNTSSDDTKAEPLHNQNENSMIPSEQCTKYATDNTQPSFDLETEIVGDKQDNQGNEGETYELECSNVTEENVPAESECENNVNADESMRAQCNLQAREEDLSGEHHDNNTENEGVSVSIDDEEQAIVARQLDNEEVESRNVDTDNESNVEVAENLNEYQNNNQNNDTSVNQQNVQQDGDNSETVDQNVEQRDTEAGEDKSGEKDDENDGWSQEDIQALLRKAINLHASERDLKTIINCGGNVNKPIKSGLYPLHYAAYTDYPQCIEILLNFGANVNVTDDIGYTPLHLAARRGNHKSMEALIENGAIINYCEPGVEIHQTDERNKLGYTTMEPINLAIQNCNPKCARLLLEHGARPNNKYFMGYEICLAPLDNPEGLELLMEFGADPNVFNRCGLSPLMKACKDHHIEAVRKLIRYGADVNALCPPLFEQKSVLQFAINSGNIVIINILLGKGAKLARQGEYRYSALHTAVTKGRADICRLLLQHGADPNEKAEEGATPMMFACSTPELIERREIVQLLLDCGADLNAYSPTYSYFDPYLAPLTEYFKCIGKKEGFGIVRLMIRNGAIINFCSSGLDMEMKRLRDPYSIVPYVHCLQDNEPMFDFVVSAAAKYSPLIIYATRNIPEDMKDSLIYAATRPRNLKHLVRASVRSQLTPGLPDKVEKLPLPPLLKSYLLFR